jgi:hypothetical protein
MTGFPGVGRRTPARGVAKSRGMERVAETSRRVMEWLAGLLSARRVFLYSTALLAFAIATYIPIIAHGDPPFDAFGHPVAIDFTAHVTAGKMALSGDLHELYDVRRQWEVQQQFLGSQHPEFVHYYISPPFVAYFYAPLAALPYTTAAGMWTALTIVLLVFSLRLLWPLVPNLHRYGFGAVLVACFSTWPVIELLVDGQDSAISLLVLVAGLWFLRGRQDSFAGGILGFGVFKPQLFFLIPVLLLLQRRWRALIAWLTTASILTASSIAMVGPDGIRSYLALITSESFQRGTQSMDWKMQSLAPLFHALFQGPAVSLATPLTLVVDAILLAMFARMASQPCVGAPRFVLLFALSILTGALVSPYFFMYDCVILLVPSLVVLNEAASRPTIRFSLALAYVLAWTTLIRYSMFGSDPWPASLLAAPWAALALLALSFSARKLVQSVSVQEWTSADGSSVGTSARR